MVTFFCDDCLNEYNFKPQMQKIHFICIVVPGLGVNQALFIWDEDVLAGLPFFLTMNGLMHILVFKAGESTYSSGGDFSSLLLLKMDLE